MKKTKVEGVTFNLDNKVVKCEENVKLLGVTTDFQLNFNVQVSSIAIIFMGKRELVALLNLSSWCLVMVEWLFFAVPWGCLRFVIVVFPDHTHLLFFQIYAKGHQNS